MIVFRMLPALLLLASAACANASDYAVEGDAIPAPLLDMLPDPQEGQRIFASREEGHCVLCHRVASLPVPFQGDLGPALDEVGARLSAGQIRLRIVDAARLNPATIMPPYYRTADLHQLPPALDGKTVLPASAIEHLVAWLSTLKGGGQP